MLQNSDGKTPLMVASINGYLNLVKKLVECGADLYVKTKVTQYLF